MDGFVLSLQLQRIHIDEIEQIWKKKNEAKNEVCPRCDKSEMVIDWL